MTNKLSRSTAGSVVVLATLAACSSVPSAGVPRSRSGQAALDHALDLAASEIGARERMPASAPDLSRTLRPDFAGLRREMEMVVLPKRSNQTEKTGDELAIDYGRPLVYRFQATRLAPCPKLVAEKINGSPHSQLFGGEASGDCAILQVTRKLPELRPAEYRHDLIALTLYLDSGYRGFGMDTWVGHSRKEVERHTLRLNPDEAVSSGLSLFPVDLPGAPQVAQARIAPARTTDDVFALNQLRKTGAGPGCKEGYEMSYRDPLGNPVRAFWCAGARWPSIVETRRYLAVARSGGAQ